MMPGGAMTWRAKPGCPPPPAGLLPWLTAPGSLTARLQALGEFAMSRLRQSPGAAWLGDSGRVVWQREVLLRVDGQALVFAHSEWSTVQAGRLTAALRGLGQRPLGPLLFARSGVQHGALAFACLPAAHPVAVRARRALGLAEPLPLWARRATHGIGPERLVVMEIFSPALADRALPLF